MLTGQTALLRRFLGALGVVLLQIETQVKNCLLRRGRDGFGMILKMAAELFAVIAASETVGAEAG